MDYSTKSYPVCSNFLPVIHCKIMDHILIVCDVVWKFTKIKPKNWLIQRSFSFTLSYTPQFLHQKKDLMKIDNQSKFHQCSICDSQVKNFQSFSHWFSIHEMVFFGVFLVLTPPILSDFADVFTRGRIQRKKPFFKESLRNSNF